MLVEKMQSDLLECWSPSRTHFKKSGFFSDSAGDWQCTPSDSDWSASDAMLKAGNILEYRSSHISFKFNTY